MAARNKPDLTTQEREAIRSARKTDPRLTYEAIGAMFNISPSCAWGVINQTFVSETQERPKVRMALPVSAVKEPESIISPINPAMLRAGRASVARSNRAA